MGIISGVPTEVSPLGSWRVTAKNVEGEAEVTLEFAVQRPAPSDLVYPTLAEEYPVLRAMAIRPTVAGEVDDYAVAPSLPGGLALDAKTGVISGTPSCSAPATTYEVTASNETGTSTATLAFCLKVMPPVALAYPTVDDLYTIGENVSIEPAVEGGATNWAAEPSLPKGLVLDSAAGTIRGAPVEPAEETSYVITASNEAGGTSVVVTFTVKAPEPVGLSYPAATDDLIVDQEVLLEPELQEGTCNRFTIEPATLPEGLELNSATGVISGTPTKVSEVTTYRITGINTSGSTNCDLTFSCSELADITGVSQKFAEMIEEIYDITEMVPEPQKAKMLGDWMVWMVHRAFLNDPTLTDFNFSNLSMPLPHLEPRIAPKLMKAVETNTSIVKLQLSHSNMQKPQGYELAESLKKNTTVQIINIESNSLDSGCLRAIANALEENPDSGLEQWRFNDQKHIGTCFGRPVEQAIGEMMEKNHRILKLGFNANDAHWRDRIDRAVLRNNDYARRRRKGDRTRSAEEMTAQNKQFKRLLMTEHPDKESWEVFEDDDEREKLCRTFMATSPHKLPTKEQLQAYARNQGKPLPYSSVAPLVKEFRKKLVSSIMNCQVKVMDVYGAEFEGVLHGWSEKNENWTLDVWTETSRFNFTADSKQTILIEIAADFAEWLQPKP